MSYLIYIYFVLIGTGTCLKLFAYHQLTLFALVTLWFDWINGSCYSFKAITLSILKTPLQLIFRFFNFITFVCIKVFTHQEIITLTWNSSLKSHGVRSSYHSLESVYRFASALIFLPQITFSNFINWIYRYRHVYLYQLNNFFMTMLVK